MKTPITMTRAYEEIIDFLAAGTTPKSLIEFQPYFIIPVGIIGESILNLKIISFNPSLILEK
ncbi:MAG: hypothetical protein AB4426_26280 [Xenococcaceae cyanobacterium]